MEIQAYSLFTVDKVENAIMKERQEYMKKVVISGSASDPKEIRKLYEKLCNQYEILDYPKPIPKENFLKVYKSVYKAFYENIANSDIFILYNYNKNGVEGHVGSAGFAELCFAIAQNVIYNKNIEIYIYKKPSKEVQSYDEICLYLELGFIKIWENK